VTEQDTGSQSENPMARDAEWWNRLFTAHIKRVQGSGYVRFLCGASAATRGREHANRLGRSPMFYIPCRRCIQIGTKQGLTISYE
jgi:hypothetical protein